MTQLKLRAALRCFAAAIVCSTAIAHPPKGITHADDKDHAEEQQHFIQGKPLTFAEIAPVLYSKCTVCHRKDGGAPFALDAYEAVKTRASSLGRLWPISFRLGPEGNGPG